MGEAKRKEQAAQGAGFASKEPIQLSPSESVRIHDLQTRAEVARAIFAWAQQQAEAAQQAWHREMIQILEEHGVDAPEEEGSWRWNHKPTKRELMWRFTPTQLRSGVSPESSTPGDVASATPTEASSMSSSS